MSAFYNKPWAPGYALPAYLNSEDPLTRGSAVTTRWAPRGTISKVPPGSKLGGYAVPQYVRDEPVGSQAHTTPWTPRGTVMSMSTIKTGLPWKSSAHTLDSNGLGALGATDKGNSSVGGANPIEQYGQKASALVMGDSKQVPLGKRDEWLRKLLDEVDPKLYPAFKKETGRLRDMGTPADPAAQRGLAVAFSQGLTKEFMRIGKKGKAPSPGLRKGQVPLGALMGFDAQANNYYHQDLGGLSGAWSKVKSTLSKLGGYACDVATHPITPIAAGAAGAYYGGPAGASTAMAGAGVAATACSAGSAGSGVMPASYGGGREMPSWAIPAIIGGGAIALLLILKK
jgi:hypothetical protein